MQLLVPLAALTGALLVGSDGWAAGSPRAALPTTLMAPNPAPLLLPRVEEEVPVGVRAARLARGLVGVPYRWGGASPASGFDCSGLVSYVYGRLGVDLPHNAAAAFGAGRPVSLTQLRPGDLLFYRGLGHMGMYLGRGEWIHAPRSGETVRVDPINGRADFVGARRPVVA